MYGNIPTLHLYTYKKGDPTLAENYRPINILPSSLIFFEQILSNHLIYFLRDNNLINDNQYGFLSGKSIDLQLLTFYRDIFKAKYNYKSSDIIYIDMAKEFDNVSTIHYYSINYLILVYKEMS